MKKNKKGAITLYFLVIALILAIGYVLLFAAPDKEELSFVGDSYAKLLSSKETRNQGVMFLDMSLKLAKQETIKDLNENSGFHIKQHSLDFPCEQAVYPVLNQEKEITCFPEIEESLKYYFRLNFDRLISQSPEILFNPGDINVDVAIVGDEILFEVETYQAIRVPIYKDFSHYQDEKIRNLVGSGMPRYSHDGQTLVPIRNIPNVVCNEEDTNFGKICAGNQELVSALRKLSAEWLVPEGKIMVITQAYRTYDIQKKFYECSLHTTYCPAECYGSCNLACHPDTPGGCPHMIAGAIDMNIINPSTGINYNGEFSTSSNREKIINKMCGYGFINWEREPWHFEYGTPWWEEAEKLRNGGERACVYPFI